MVDLAKKVQVSTKDVSNIEQFSIYAQNVSLSAGIYKVRSGQLFDFA